MFAVGAKGSAITAPSETETAPPLTAPETSQAHDDMTEDELAMLLAEKLGRIR